MARLINNLGSQIQSPMYFHPDYKDAKMSSSFVSFPWQSAEYDNGNTRIQIDCTFEIFEKGVLMSKLVMRSFFDVRELKDDEESMVLLEHIHYLSYDMMLKAHAYQYKGTIIADYEVILPEDLSETVRNMLTELLA